MHAIEPRDKYIPFWANTYNLKTSKGGRKELIGGVANVWEQMEYGVRISVKRPNKEQTCAPTSLVTQIFLLQKCAEGYVWREGKRGKISSGRRDGDTE